jgi:hypothetical protein
MTDDPYGSSGVLDAADGGRLEAVRFDLGHGNSRTVAELVAGWAAHVRRLAAERDRDAADRDVWTAHDYVAALLIRRFVARALEGLDDAGLRERTAVAVTRVDDELRGFTEPDGRGLVRGFAADDAGTPDPVREWWWSRIPVSGPVRAELEGFAAGGG